MDEELLALLKEEIERRLAAFEADPSPSCSRSIAHALKGALGLAGEREVSEAFARIERRITAGDADAIEDLGALLQKLAELLREGRPLPTSTWPDPPADLRPSQGPDPMPSDYAAAVHDRIGRIDAALAGARDAEAARVVFREVHTIKGAALSVGDDLMAWFCHGLEEKLKAATNDAAAKLALDDVDAYRGVLAEIVDAPDHALETLKHMSGAPPRPSRPPLLAPLPLPPRRPAVDLPSESDLRGLADADTVRVSSGVLDGLFERAGQLGQLRAPLSGGAHRLQRAGNSARAIRHDVREALRMIGPPRPWGAPAAAIARLETCAARLLPLAELADTTSGQMTALSRRLAREGETLAATVQTLRTTPAATLLDRLAVSARSEAGRLGKLVNVTISGGDKPVDRRILDALVDPMRQLVRNAVAHGIELPDARVRSEKAAVGALRLFVAQRDGMLTIGVEDDGAGVDVSSVRARALERGLVSDAEAGCLDDHAVLSLLFSPGFSLKRDADLLAGRGVGLDLTLAAVQRMGGSVQLSSRPGLGLTATISVPAEASLVRVIWLECAADAFAMPVQHIRSIHRIEDWARPAASLRDLLEGCIDPDRAGPDRLVVEIVPALRVPTSTGPVGVAVEGVGSIDEVALRALPVLPRSMAPFGAGIVWADELRLSLDPLRLARSAAVAAPAVR